MNRNQTGQGVDEESGAQSNVGEPPLSEADRRLWERYRAVAIGHRLTLKGPPRKVGLSVRMELRCAYNHSLALSGKNLMRGIGCVECDQAEAQAFRERQFEDAHDLARRRGGLCLSGSYANARTPLVWECHRGHQWRASLDNVRSKGSWCARCVRSLPRPERRKVKTSSGKA